MTPQLFKSENNTKAEEFKKFLPLNVTCSFRSLAPAIAQSERKYLLPVLGNTLFNRIATYYASADNTDGMLSTLLEMCQYALIRLAYWQDYDILSVSLSDKGAADNAGEGRLYRYQSEAVKRSLKEGGFNQLDAVLEYCEEHLSQLPEYTSSPCYISSQKTLVSTTRQFNEIFNIGESRLVFLKMRYFIETTEHTELCHRIGHPFFEQLLQADETLPQYVKLLPLLRRFIVYWSVADGISELHRLPTEKGLVFETQHAAGSSDVSVSVVAPQEMEQMAEQYRRKAERYMAAAVDLLKHNLSQYPAYRQFAGADAPRNEVFRRDNTNRKIFYA